MKENAIRILAISGTPRKGGNSEILLEAALEPFAEEKWDMTKFFLSEKTVEMCICCETCIETEKCFIDDDMSELYQELERCDCYYYFLSILLEKRLCAT